MSKSPDEPSSGEERPPSLPDESPELETDTPPVTEQPTTSGTAQDPTATRAVGIPSAPASDLGRSEDTTTPRAEGTPSMAASDAEDSEDTTATRMEGISPQSGEADASSEGGRSEDSGAEASESAPPGGGQPQDPTAGGWQVTPSGGGQHQGTGPGTYPGAGQPYDPAAGAWQGVPPGGGQPQDPAAAAWQSAPPGGGRPQDPAAVWQGGGQAQNPGAWQGRQPYDPAAGGWHGGPAYGPGSQQGGGPADGGVAPGQQPAWAQQSGPYQPQAQQSAPSQQQAQQQGQPYRQTPAWWNQAGPPPGAPAKNAVAGERDRLSVHLVWEGFLALVVVVLIGATLAMTPHQNVSNALDQVGYIGLVATGLAFSLRTGSPNLAVGSILGFTATLASYLVAQHDWGKPAALFAAILLATIVGLALGLLVAVMSVPAWAATLGAATALQGVQFWLTKGILIPFHLGGDYPTAAWLGLFAVLSVGGGALWLVPGVRGPLSAIRHPGDPARWAGLRAGMGPLAGLTGSSLLASVAAIPMLMRTGVAESVTGNSTTLLVLSAVLLGGVSVYGRRAGVFGTLLGVLILVMTQMLIVYNGISIWLSSLLVGLLALAGLGVSRGIESITTALNSRPHPQSPPPAARPLGPPALPPGR